MTNQISSQAETSHGRPDAIGSIGVLAAVLTTATQAGMTPGMLTGATIDGWGGVTLQLRDEPSGAAAAARLGLTESDRSYYPVKPLFEADTRLAHSITWAGTVSGHIVSIRAYWNSAPATSENIAADEHSAYDEDQCRQAQPSEPGSGPS